MDGAPRYEIVNTIATGDFAVVYRARDRELGREVAIKQIHQQFLTDPHQLARYWQEAQLLASLQHPNILTIYDVVRPKGWLILELMRGSLQPATQSDGIDLDFLRIALSGCLSALGFLHANGVIHGDIKPSNMLVDQQGRVKLGDFGLARRASNEGGSLLKGTTKYMAPELVSDQFGAVGPASDLYSLGFSAYELMCGKQFETLFPGLGAFGRDKQIAWMMWQAAADRNLPPINRVLEGVPEDLARVIQHLVTKDQARRCQSAKEALWELRIDPLLAAARRPSEAEAAAEAAQAVATKRKRRMRLAAVAATACSAVLCAVMLWPRSPALKPAGPPAPVRGVITNVYPDEWPRKLAIRADNGVPKEISLAANDLIYINDKRQLLRNLRAHDQVMVRESKDDSGRQIKEILAFRPEIDAGRLKDLKPQERQLTLTIDEGERRGKELTVSVPRDLAITLNGRPQLAGQPVKLADLRRDDRVTVHHLGKDTGREATELSVERVVTVEGKIVELSAADAKKEPQLKVNVGTDDKPDFLVLPFAPDCQITLNGRQLINNQVLKPADLRTGNKVKLAHDSRAVRVDAYRVLEVSGTIEAVHYDAKSIEVAQESGQPVTCLVGPQCKITVGGRPAQLADLRRGDLVEVAHDSPGAASPEALSVTARRPADQTRWAILIGVQNYEDQSLARLDHTDADAKLLHDTLVDWYKVPADQAVLFSDDSLVRLEQGIPPVLGRITAEDKLVVYFAGHAYRAEDGRVYLAPRTSICGGCRTPDSRCNGWSMSWKNARPARSCCCWIAVMPGWGRIWPRSRHRRRCSAGCRPPAAALRPPHRNRHRELQGRPARRRLAGEAARPVCLAPGPRLHGGRRCQPRRPHRANRTVRLSPGGDGRCRGATEGGANARVVPARQPPPAAERRCQGGDPQAGGLPRPGQDRRAGGREGVRRRGRGGRQGA